MGSKRSHPTLSDVAACAGVSSASVSRYLNNPSTVASKTAARIEAAIKETGYTPNLVAGALASNRSRLVSILIPQLNPLLFIDTVESIVDELSANGNVVTVGVSEFDPQRSREQVKAAIAYRAKAIIITANVSEEDKALIRQSNMSAIEIWDLPDDPIDIAIGFSHYDIGRELARFVKNRGYVRPHFITNSGTRAEKRRCGFADQWQSFSDKPHTETFLELPLQYENSRAAFAEIRRLDQMPDVVLCSADWLAQGIIIEAGSFGLKVPDDLAVIGFGNSGIASEMRPTITSIDIDGNLIARHIIDVLNKRDRNEEIASRAIDVGFRIIARESA